MDRLLPRHARGALALGTLVAALLGTIVYPIVSTALGVDAEFGGPGHDGYLQLARSLGRGDGYVFEPGGAPVFHRPPLLAWLLAPITWLPTDVQRTAFALAQALLVGLATATTFRLAERFTSTRGAGIAAVVLLANPWLHWFVRLPMSPILQLTLFAAFLLLLVGPKDPGDERSLSLRRALPAGVLGGALALTHGTMLLTVVGLCASLALVAAARRRPHDALRAAAVLGIAALCVAPWTARNWSATDRFLPVVGNAGFVYFAGSAHWGLGENTGRTGDDLRERALAMALAGDAPVESIDDVVEFWGIRDPALDRELTQRAREHLLADVPRLAQKMVLNGLEVFFPIVHPILRGSDYDSPLRVATAGDDLTSRVGRELGKLVRSLYYALLWILALRGIRRQRALGGRPIGVPLAIVVTAVVLPYTPFIAFIQSNAYAVATLPALAIAASCGWRAGREPTTPSPGG